MVGLIASELRHRLGRTLALLLGIVVATASFTVLTGAAASQRLEVRGTVAKRFRTAYDILVRPRGTRTALERQAGLVAPNATSGVFGGISLAQLRAVRAIPGVEVAAPIATIGYLLPDTNLPVPLAGVVRGRGRVLLRVRTQWVSDRGRSIVNDAARYVYVTPRRLLPPFSLINQPDPPIDTRYDLPSALEALPGDRSVPVCPSEPDALAAGPFSRPARQRIDCFSRQTGIAPLSVYGTSRRERRLIAAYVPFSFPFLLAAIDPRAEAQLAGVDRALSSGRYLREADRPRLLPADAHHGVARYEIPVLASSRPFVDLAARVSVERLSQQAAEAVVRTSKTKVINRLVARQPPGPVVLRIEIGPGQPYAQLLHEMSTQNPFLAAYWTSGAVRYRRLGPRALAPVAVANSGSVWTSTLSGVGSASFADVPQSGRQGDFRRLERYAVRNDTSAQVYPALHAVGRFDPDRIPGFLHPDSAPLSTYVPPVAEPADARSRALLADRSLLPDGNPAGYLTPPPLLLTTLASLEVLEGEAAMEEVPPFAQAPISLIRVRVAGVHGADEVSRERIRLAAQGIVRATGLDVDVTAGASPTGMQIDLPRGKAGRPALIVRESWVEQGVAVAILEGIDGKSLTLFCLVLLVCALFCTNAAAAAVRGRRVELGVLACVGWRPRTIFALVIGEVALIGVVAGLLGGGLALALSPLTGDAEVLARAALAVPGATLLAVLAGLLPARTASRAAAVEATRPAVTSARVNRPARSIASLALSNLLRVPGRTALGAASLGIGTFALTLLLAVVLAFRGAVVGSLLGNAVSLQVRGPDYAAVVAILVLGALAIADVLYLNIRDRAGELAAMRATGWHDRHLTTLVALEGTSMGAFGALVGTALGLIAALLVAGTLPASLLLVSVTGAAVGTLVAALAAVVPAALVRRLPTAELLAAD